MLLTISLSMLIGLLLGLLGGGGSILTVPMLVYVLHIEPKMAIVTSFVVVGSSSLIALIAHARRGGVCWKSGLIFGFTGMLGSFWGGRLAAHFPGDVLMSLFGAICLLAGVSMLHRKKTDTHTTVTVKESLRVCPFRVPYLRVMFDGFFVGGLTGLVGVGGGFLIVPVLTLLVGFSIKGAIGTSLLIIAMNAIAGLAGYSQHVSLDINLTTLVAGGTISGTVLGSFLSAYVKPDSLRRAFGLMVILVAAYILYKSLTVQFVDTIEQWLTMPDRPELKILGLLIFWLLLRIGFRVHKTDTACLA